MSDSHRPHEIPEGKKIVERENRYGEKEWVVRDDPNYGGRDCWIATAYYGDTYDPHVVLLRNFRNRMMDQNYIGSSMKYFNRLYYKLGGTPFGIKWGEGLRNGKRIYRVISIIILKTLLAITYVTTSWYDN